MNTPSTGGEIPTGTICGAHALLMLFAHDPVSIVGDSNGKLVHARLPNETHEQAHQPYVYVDSPTDPRRQQVTCPCCKRLMDMQFKADQDRNALMAQWRLLGSPAPPYHTLNYSPGPDALPVAPSMAQLEELQHMADRMSLAKLNYPTYPTYAPTQTEELQRLHEATQNLIGGQCQMPPQFTTADEFVKPTEPRLEWQTVGGGGGGVVMPTTPTDQLKEKRINLSAEEVQAIINADDGIVSFDGDVAVSNASVRISDEEFKARVRRGFGPPEEETDDPQPIIIDEDNHGKD